MVLYREGILNMIMYALLAFPSNEFDLKNIAATVVPTLVDPKRRVRQASLGNKKEAINNVKSINVKPKHVKPINVKVKNVKA